MSKWVRNSVKSIQRGSHLEVSLSTFLTFNLFALGNKQSTEPKSEPKEPPEGEKKEKQEQPPPEESKQPEPPQKVESKPGEKKATPPSVPASSKTESATHPPPPTPVASLTPFNRDERRVWLLPYSSLQV